MLTKLISTLKSIGQLLVNESVKDPSENVTSVKLPKLGLLYVPTLDSLIAGNGAVTLEAFILVPEIPKVMASNKSIGTEVPPDPVELTELIFIPIEAGKVTQSRLLL